MFLSYADAAATVTAMRAPLYVLQYVYAERAGG